MFKIFFLLLVFISFLFSDLTKANIFDEQLFLETKKKYGLNKIAQEMAAASNRTLEKEGGYVQIDRFTNYTGSKSYSNIHISEITISKEQLIEYSAEQYNVSKDKVKKILDEAKYIDTVNYVKEDLRAYNKNRLCGLAGYKGSMKHGIKFQLVYSFNDGNIIDIQTFEYKDCMK